MFFIVGGVKTGLELSTFHHRCFYSVTFPMHACTQITMHGYSFQLIFSKWEQKWVFSLVPGGTLSGAAADLRRWQPCCFFSGRVRSVTLSGLRSAAPETSPRAPWPPALSCTHMCILPPRDQGRRRTFDKATGFRLRGQENLHPLPVWFLKDVLLRITGSKQSSTAAPDSTGRYLTTNTYSGAENAADSASRCYIKAEQGY